MKRLVKMFFMISIFFISCFSVSARTIIGIANESGANIRSGASTAFSIIGRSKYGEKFTIIGEEPTQNIGVCSSSWYKFDYNGSDGFICGDFITLYITDDEIADGEVEEDSNDEVPSTPSEDIEENNKEKDEIEYRKSLEELGFPSSYIPYLIYLHEKHPNWTFEPLLTGIKFEDAVKAESALGVSLIQDNYADDGWKSTVSPAYDYLTDTWKSYDSGSWVAVNSDTVSYFLDPRNFLNDVRIFQFEKLNFDESYQTIETVQGVFGENSLSYPLAATFVEAGKTYNVNAVYLAAKVRGEVGVDGSGSTSGKPFTYNGIKYDGSYYNVYNIGAYKTSAGSAIDRGLYWAMGGFGLNNPDVYLRPWTSLELSIKGGANFIAKGYINAGQHTTYLQKFNVGKGYVGTSHQYQTDIRAPYHASESSYQSYYNNDLIGTSFKFVIPVFEEMPEATYLPAPGNPNNHLKELKVNGESVSNFNHEVNEYTFYVRSGATSVTIEATPINKNASIAGSGAIMLTGDTTISKVEVTSQNGIKNTYTLNIIKSGTIEMTTDEIIDESKLKRNGSYISGVQLGTTLENLTKLIKETCVGASINIKTSGGIEKIEGRLGTGDVITVTNGSTTADYTLVIYGDTSGDGEITILDLLQVQKHILGYTTLNASFNTAGDVSRDNEITILDLLKIQKQILGYADIEQ